MKLKKRSALLAVGCSLVAGAGIATTATGNVTKHNARTARVAQASDAGVASSYALLRRAVTSQDALPSSFVDKSARYLGGWERRTGANLALARRADTGSGAVWIVPGVNRTCILSSRSASSPEVDVVVCGSAEAVTSGQLASSLISADGRDFVAGLAPDGVGSVTLTLDDGSSHVVDVHSNVYAADLGQRAATLSFTGPSGPTKTRLY
jgi:hypothetical protein